VGVGARAVIGVIAVAALVGLGAGLLLRGGGDDDGGSDEPSDTAAEAAADDEDGTGEFDVEAGDELPVSLEAGDALRVVASGADVGLLVAASEEAQTEGFEDLEPRDQTLFGGEELDVGLVFLATDRSGDDVEGLQFVAPTAGTYTVVVTGDGFGSDQGDAIEVTIEVEPGDDDGLDPDSIEYLDYLAHYGEHVEFFCDEDFFDGDPEDVTNYGPTVCDADALAGVLSGELNGDFTNDFEVQG
jgi:hypothetical protein